MSQNDDKLILVKLFDCVHPLAWPCRQRLNLFFRLTVRRYNSLFKLVTYEDDSESSGDLDGSGDGILMTCLKEAFELEVLSGRYDEKRSRSSILPYGGDQSEKKRNDDLNYDNILYTIYVVYGDNLAFLQQLRVEVDSNVQIFVMKDTGFGSKRIAQILNCEDEDNIQNCPDAEETSKMRSMRDRITWVDLSKTDNMMTSLVDEIAQSTWLSCKTQIETLVHWGQLCRASDMIRDLKQTASGRKILRENFWKSFIRLFALGDAATIDTLLYHEIVDFKDMTLDHLKELTGAVVDRQRTSLFHSMLIGLTSYQETTPFIEHDFSKISCELRKNLFDDFMVRQEEGVGVRPDRMAKFAFLFHLAIFCLNKELSLVIWKRLDRRMHFCLSAGVTLEKLRKMNFTQKSNHLQTGIVELQDFYEKELINITNQLAAQDFTKLKKIMIANIYPDWFRYNIVVTAEMAKFERFFAQRAVLELILTVWTGRLKSHIKDRYVVLGLFCPWMIPFMEFERAPQVKAFQLIENPRSTITDVLNVNPVALAPKYRSFYMAPITKFWANFFMFALFLLYFTLFMLSGERYKGIGLIESVLMVYVCAYAVEEFVQMYYSGDNLINSFQQYLEPDQNKLDFALLIFFIFTFSIRLLHYDFIWGVSAIYLSDTFYVSSLIISYTRLLFFLMIKPSLGPYIIMLQFMIKDLTAFLVILFTAVLGFGAAMESLLVINKPNRTFSDDIWGFFIKPTMQMYGFDLFLDDITVAFNCTEGDNVFADNVLGSCPAADIRPHFLLVLTFAFYTATGVILLNLLIAIFSDTYSRVREDTSFYWNYVFYERTIEYSTRDVLPCPFSLVIRTVQLARWIVRKMRSAGIKVIEMETCFIEKPERAKQQECLRVWAQSLENNYVVENYFTVD